MNNGCNKLIASISAILITGKVPEGKDSWMQGLENKN